MLGLYESVEKHPHFNYVYLDSLIYKCSLICFYSLNSNNSVTSVSHFCKDETEKEPKTTNLHFLTETSLLEKHLKMYNKKC